MKNVAPPDENVLRRISFRSTKPGAWEQVLLLDNRAKVRKEGVFIFHRHRYHKYGCHCHYYQYYTLTCVKTVVVSL